MTDRGDTDTYGGIFWVRAMDGSWSNASAGEACIEITRLRAENARLREALYRTLNYIENTESRLAIKLGCGDAARAALEVKP